MPSPRRSESLAGRTFFGVLSVAAVLLLGGLAVVGSRGRQLAIEETSRRIEQVGSNMVLDLTTRTQEIAALARTLAATAERLPKSEATFKRIIPGLIDFQGDLDVVSGGVWPEPYAFDPDKEKRSFFWTRNSEGSLEYDEQYNLSEEGYHDQFWYIVVKHLEAGKCSWSKSYRDPFTGELMVTATVATYDEGRFSGAVTIDYRISGLQALAEDWQRKTGGYVFITDQYDTFISLPDPSLLSDVEEGTSQEHRIKVAELAGRVPLFAPIAEVLFEMGKSLLKDAEELPSFDPKMSGRIAADSPQIGAAEADVLAATILDPFAGSSFFRRFKIDDDHWIGGEATVFTFFVPYEYWKVGVVVPSTDAAGSSRKVAFWLILYLVPLGVLLAGAAYLVVGRRVDAPLARTRELLEQVSSGVRNLDPEAAGVSVDLARRDEIGSLADSVKRLIGAVEEERESAEEREQRLRAELEELRDSEELLSRQVAQLEEGVAGTVGTEGETVAAAAPADGSTPRAMSRVWDAVLLLSPSGTISEEWGDALLREVAEETRREPVRIVVVDLTSSPGGDPQRIAGILSRLGRSVGLIGARVLVVGLDAATAAALAELDDGDPGIRGFSRLRDALQEAISDRPWTT